MWNDTKYIHASEACPGDLIGIYSSGGLRLGLIVVPYNIHNGCIKVLDQGRIITYDMDFGDENVTLIRSIDDAIS